MTNSDFDDEGASSDDSILDVLDSYGVEYQCERRYGRQWIQVRAGSNIGVHIVDGLRAVGYQLHSFASDTTMNFVKVDDDGERSGVRSREEVQEKLEEVEEEIEAYRESDVNPSDTEMLLRLQRKRLYEWFLGKDIQKAKAVLGERDTL